MTEGQAVRNTRNCGLTRLAQAQPLWFVVDLSNNLLYSMLCDKSSLQQIEAGRVWAYADTKRYQRSSDSVQRAY